MRSILRPLIFLCWPAFYQATQWNSTYQPRLQSVTQTHRLFYLRFLVSLKKGASSFLVALAYTAWSTWWPPTCVNLQPSSEWPKPWGKKQPARSALANCSSTLSTNLTGSCSIGCNAWRCLFIVRFSKRTQYQSSRATRYDKSVCSIVDPKVHLPRQNLKSSSWRTNRSELYHLG